MKVAAVQSPSILFVVAILCQLTLCGCSRSRDLPPGTVDTSDPDASVKAMEDDPANPMNQKKKK